jgi:hypothetical protein
MMYKHLTLLIAALVLLTLPLVASAQYLSPEDVIWDLERLLPPSARESRARVEEQARKSAVRREREQAEAFAPYQKKDPETQDIDLAQSVSSLEEAVERLIQKESTSSDRRVDRMVQRIDERQTVLRAPARMEVMGGPPLYGTGLTSMAGLFAVICASAWTLRRAWKL